MWTAAASPSRAASAAHTQESMPPLSSTTTLGLPSLIKSDFLVTLQAVVLAWPVLGSSRCQWSDIVDRRVIGEGTQGHISDSPSVFLDIFLFRLGPVRSLSMSVRGELSFTWRARSKINVVGPSQVFVAKALRWDTGDDVGTVHAPMLVQALERRPERAVSYPWRAVGVEGVWRAPARQQCRRRRSQTVSGENGSKPPSARPAHIALHPTSGGLRERRRHAARDGKGRPFLRCGGCSQQTRSAAQWLDSF